jgi:amidohydrolase
VGGHGVVGVLRGGAPVDGKPRVIALRADIDALPVKEHSGEAFASTVVDEDYPGGPFPVAHACGHDCHVAMLMGAASVLSPIRKRLPGTVLFVFQGAEEGPPLGEDAGAAAMERAGAIADPVPTMVFGMHVSPMPVGWVGYASGNFYAASAVMEIDVNGVGVHRSTPWEGIDPLPVAADIVSQLAQIYRQIPAYNPVTVTVGQVTTRGRHNVIGDTVQLLGTVRCSVDADMAEIQRRVARIAEHLAQAQGCRAATSFHQPVPAVNNSPAWVHAALPTLEDVIGHERLIEVPPTLGYDDVSVFISKCGGLYVMLGCQDLDVIDGKLVELPGGRGMAFNHNSRFCARDDALEVGVRLHAHVAVDHLAGSLVVDQKTADSA